MNVFENKQEQGIFQLGIDEMSKAYLQESGRWGKFLAILSFIGIGLLIVIGVFMGMFMSRMMGSNAMGATGPMFTVIYLVLGAVYIYPVWCLFKFSTLIKRALNTSNQEQFNEALRYQKNMFKFIGIVAIITLVLYGVAIIFMIIGAAMAM
jgi:hypothetical protein